MTQRIILAARVLLGISILGILSVSLMAFHSPQSVMDLVQVTLPNTDSMSSIRGVFGGAGLTISIILIRLAIKKPTARCANHQSALGLLRMLSLAYPLGRWPIGCFWYTVAYN